MANTVNDDGSHMRPFWTSAVSDEAAALTDADLRAAFDKIVGDDARQVEYRARFSASWAEAFPHGYSHFTEPERAFLSRMWMHGEAGEPIHPKEYERLQELQTRRQGR